VAGTTGQVDATNWRRRRPVAPVNSAG